MPWFPVDDAFHSHPKARKAGDEALGMWTRAGAHCMAYLTDGFVADWWIRQQPRGVVKARRLVAAELWRPAQKDGEQGFQFHDWKPECTKEHVLAVREKARQRKARSRESQEPSRVTDSVSPASCLVPTQTNPNQPINTLVDFSGGVTQVAPSPTCPRHPSGTNLPCGACADARRAKDAWDTDHQQHELARRRALKAAIHACLVCDENGMRDTGAGLTRCSHEKAVNA